MISQSSEQPALSQRGLLYFSSAASGNRSWQIAIPIFFVTCFFMVSRVIDLATIWDPQYKYFRLVAVLLALLAVSLVAGGRALVFWKSSAGKVLPFFVAWIVLSYLASQHSKDSQFVVLNILRGALLFLAATGLLATVSDFKKFFTLLAAAGLTASALGVVWSTVRDGRFALRAGSFEDPNYYAMSLLALAPIVWVSFPGKPWWIGLCRLLATAFPVLLAIRTASRGGFLAMLAMLVVLFLLSSLKTRILIAGLGILALVVLLAFLPASLRIRLASAARISSADANQQALNPDQVSLDARQTLLMTSINVTLANPVLGLGPGNFGPTIAEFGRLQGVQWLTLNTHNSYTQISSETGIPGLILLLLVIVLSTKSAVSVLRQTSLRGANPDPDIHRFAAGLLVSLAATYTCMLFLSEGYNPIVFLWLGLACGLRLLVAKPPRDDEDEFIEMQPGQATEG